MENNTLELIKIKVLLGWGMVRGWSNGSQLRLQISLADGPILVTNMHTGQLKTALMPAPEDPTSSSGLQVHLDHTEIQTYTNTYIHN